ncbi:MAG: hypothetical protein ACYDEJ_03410 [Desulfitobacteriaceae bacterium]
MSYQFYITPTDYLAAARNGVSANALEQRIRARAWPKERAIATPPRTMRFSKSILNLAKQNGISYNTFISRVNWGWDKMRAATEPLQDRKEQVRIMHEKRRVYPREFVEMAKKNGIKYTTFKARVLYGWDMEAAATRPVKGSEDKCSVNYLSQLSAL